MSVFGDVVGVVGLDDELGGMVTSIRRMELMREAGCFVGVHARKTTSIVSRLYKQAPSTSMLI